MISTSILYHLAQTNSTASVTQSFTVIYRISNFLSQSVALRLIQTTETIAERIERLDVCIQKNYVRQSLSSIPGVYMNTVIQVHATYWSQIKQNATNDFHRQSLTNLSSIQSNLQLHRISHFILSIFIRITNLIILIDLHPNTI